MNEYFIGVSVSELQQWLADDELQVLTDRITHSRTQLGRASPGSELQGLFESMPAFALDDPAGVLIVQVSGPATWRPADHPGIRCMGLSDVKKFVPLTEDARTALTVQWSGVIELSEAVFEHKFTYFRIGRKSISSRRAGNLFANLFIDHGAEAFMVNDCFAGSLPRALMAAEHRKPDEIAETFGQEAGGLPETWVERAFGDTRYDRRNNPVNLKGTPVNLRGIFMLGVLLSKVEAAAALTDQLRGICKRLEPKAHDHQSLALIYADPGLSGLPARLSVDAGGTESVSLVTLALFLHWKLAFHDQRSTVNALSILDDVRRLAGMVDVALVADALWMMGAYLGMENITPAYRHLHQKRYPALRFAGREGSLEPVRAWHLTGTGCPAGQDGAAGVVQDIATITTPGQRAALPEDAGTSGTEQSGRQPDVHIPETGQKQESQEHTAGDTGQPADRRDTGGPSAGHTCVSPEDAHGRQVPKGPGIDSAFSEPGQKMPETGPSGPTAEAPVSRDVPASGEVSDQDVEDRKQTALSVPPGPEGKPKARSRDPAKRQKRPAKSRTGAALEPADLSPRAKSAIPADPAETGDGPGGREDGNTAGKGLQSGLFGD